MGASSHKLAAALAQRLNEIAPAPFRLSAEEGRVNIYVGDVLDTESFTPEIIEDETRDLSEVLFTASWSVLSALQDVISELTRDAWPSTDGRTMALPDVRVDADAVHLWYGDERAPMIRLPAIRLAEIMKAAADDLTSEQSS